MTRPKEQPKHAPELLSDPAVARVPLTRGYEALIDASDLDRVKAIKWHASGVEGYLIAAWRGRMPDGGKQTIMMHRLLMDAPEGMEVDHINANPLDNRRQNLRLTTHQQNLQNTSIRSHNTSGFKGVAKSGLRWRAYIGHHGRPSHIGSFDTAEEAAQAYDMESFRLYGEFARPNFPKSFYEERAREAELRAKRLAWLDSDAGRAAYEAHIAANGNG